MRGKLLLATFGFRYPPPVRELPGYQPAARRLQAAYNLNFPRYLKHLYW